LWDTLKIITSRLAEKRRIAARGPLVIQAGFTEHGHILRQMRRKKKTCSSCTAGSTHIDIIEITPPPTREDHRISVHHHIGQEIPYRPIT